MAEPRKHAELIKAWADGAEIQWKNKVDGYWEDCHLTPYWKDDCEYRLKPTRKELCELTDEEIIELEQKWVGVEIVDVKDLIRAILKKASEK
jgi:hypothetical protein